MKPHESSSTVDGLAAKLAAANISEMATGLASDPQIQALWKERPEPAPYAAIVREAGRPDAVRFAAALVLLSEQADALWRLERPIVAQVFAAALQQDLAGWSYPWGWLWASPGDSVGTLGRVFVELGPPAVPALAALLDDPSPRTGYVGSEEATEMAMRQYRVKDFAAFYIARIRGLALPWEPSLSKRDEAIARLRAQLPPA
jgi:hypothetical protein